MTAGLRSLSVIVPAYCEAVMRRKASVSAFWSAALAVVQPGPTEYLIIVLASNAFSTAGRTLL